jgi:hypothetical protein
VIPLVSIKAGKAPVMLRSLLAAALAAWLPAAALAGAPCPATPHFNYLGVQILRTPRGAATPAWLFRTDAKLIDADGAPNAYHPADATTRTTPQGDPACPARGHGLDCLASAGFPGSDWWQTVLVTDPAHGDRPLIQQSGPWAGYYVSMTTLSDTSAAGPQDPASYVNADTTPYIVLPAPIYRTAGMGDMGDIGYAINLDNGRATPFVVADEGPVEPLGEASVAFWRAMGNPAPNPRNGAGLSDAPIAYVVFPRSRLGADLGWPITPARLAAQADRLLATIGGQAGLLACLAPQGKAP